jgi:PAS domain S-box-containing protein
MAFPESDKNSETIPRDGASLSEGASEISALPSAPQMRDIFDNVFDLYGLLDTNGRVIFVSGSVFEQAKTDPGLLVGQRLADTVYWQSSDTTPQIIQDAIGRAAAGQVQKALLDFRVNSDKKVAMEVRFLPVKDGGRQESIFMTGLKATSYDIPTTIGDASLSEFFAAADSADIGLWFWDCVHDEMFATSKCNDLLGLPSYDRISYKKVFSAVHPEDRDSLESSLTEALEKGTKFTEEFRIVYPDGRLEWVCAEGKSFLDDQGKPHKMSAAVRRITNQKLAEQELTRVNDLERKARDEAEDANRAKDFFLAFVSHELRSPLNAILGWAKILLTKQVDDETRRNALETIERSARSQTKLINDLVDSARVASGKISLEFRPTNLFEVVKVSVNAQKPAAESRNIELEFTYNDENAIVFGDANRLQQIFNNLITNAIKFTDEGGHIGVDLKSSDGQVVINICDNGRGISPDSLPNIFRQFSQSDPSDDIRKGGLGLGLSIAKILINKHGGTVEAASEGIGRGSTFTVKIPLKDVEISNITASANESNGGPRSLNGIDILVVEDDVDSREVLQLFLEQAGASVRSSASARAAMATLLESPDLLPDIIISDLAMPEEDGYSLVRRIRALPAAKGGQVPALALSAFAGNENKQRAYEAGFDGYCTKPFDPEQITRVILQLNHKMRDVQAA